MIHVCLASRPLPSRFVLLLLVFSLGLAPVLHAQPSAFHFEHFPELGPIVWFAHQDQEGFLWIGTWEGLFRYDGHDFKGYFHVPEDTTSLLSNNVFFAREDREGTLWFGTHASGNRPGLNRYDRKTDAFARFAYSGSGLNTIYEDRAGTLWVGTQDRGLNRFDPESGTFIPFTPDPKDAAGLGRADVRVIYEDRAGALWLGVGGSEAVRGGLARFERDKETFTHYAHDPANPTSIGPGAVSAILQDSEGRFWIGTSEGDLCRMDLPEETFSCHRLNPDVKDNVVTKIHEDASGMLWVGTEGGGLHRFDPETDRFERFYYDAASAAGLEGHALRSNRILGINEDQSGVLWVSTFGGGLYKLSRPAPLFTAYVPPAPEPGVYGILEDRAGLLWLSTPSGLYRLDRRTGQWTGFVHDPNDPTSLSHPWAVDLYEDASGLLWVGTWGGGLNRYDPETGTFTHFRHEAQDSTSLSGDHVWDIYEDRTGRLWIGTREGLSLMDRERGTFTRFTHEPDDSKSIGARAALAVLEDRKGRFWVGTSMGGLNLMDREAGTFTRYVSEPNDPASLSINDVNAIAEDAAGMLWIGTHGGGLNRFDPEAGTFTRFNTANSCLPSNRVVAILEDEAGYLWLNTGLGLVKFDPEARTCVTYDTYDGLAGLHGFREGYKSPRGEFFFATFSGAHAFFPEEITGSAQPPPVVLTDFRLFHQSVVPGPERPLKERITAAEEIVLAHDQNSVGFEFAALHFVRPEKNRYAYRLEGFDEDWIQAGNLHTASYTNLPPGAYVFRVKAANSDGVWNEEGASIRMVVLPPWWRTLWAYALYGLLLAAGVFTIDRVQRRRLIQKEREKARERELEQAHEIEAANARLRANEEHLEAQNALLQQQKTQIEAQAEQLRTLDAVKARFFANISHEFRTPLTLLLGPIQDALKAGNPERLGEHLPLMQRNAERLLSLIGQLLDLSKLEAGGMHLRAREVDLVPWLRQFVTAFASRAEQQGLTLVFDPELQSLPCYVDADKLEKVVLNLLSNAFKFIARGGKVRVRLAQRRADTGAWAEIAVQDTGQGIPPQELPRIFDRFHQVEGSATRPHEGTGIGLALARELVELHHGTITVESTEQFGSTFTVCLPLGCEHLQESEIIEDAGPTAALPVGAVSTLSPEGDGTAGPAYLAEPDAADARAAPTVLVVEDNADMRAYLKSHLAPHYRLAEAIDGATGLEAARSLEPDLIISDVMMPEIDGYELCRQVKSNPKLNHIPVVLLTARADEASRLEGLATGADDYLSKPFNAEELLVRVENMIELRHSLRARFGGQRVVGPSEIVVKSAEAAFMEQVRDVVEAHLADTNFGVDQLAAEVGLSARQLLRRVKETAGVTPDGYIRMLRLERAAQLLAQQAGTVSEVAYAVGFKQPQYFSKLFRQVFGVPPSEYAADRL